MRLSRWRPISASYTSATIFRTHAKSPVPPMPLVCITELRLRSASRSTRYLHRGAADGADGGARALTTASSLPSSPASRMIGTLPSYICSNSLGAPSHT